MKLPRPASAMALLSLRVTNHTGDVQRLDSYAGIPLGYRGSRLVLEVVPKMSDPGVNSPAPLVHSLSAG